MNEEEIPKNTKLTKDKLLECLLLCLNESGYLNYFKHDQQHHYSQLGYTAVTNMNSKIRHMLEVMSVTLSMQLEGYELPVVKVKKLTKKELKEIDKQRVEKEKEDMARYESLERAWKEDEPRAHQEMIDNAEKAAQNIFSKNQELKKTKE